MIRFYRLPSPTGLAQHCNTFSRTSARCPETPISVIAITTLISRRSACHHCVILVHWYMATRQAFLEVERVQTGVRLEKRLLKVLKAVAELKDLSLGDLLEGIVLHAFEGLTPFSEQTLKEIDQLRKVYGLTLKAADSHKLKERVRR
jgi:hypothetical protein